MKKASDNVLNKNEIKFWLGIIAIIVSVLLSSNTVIVRIALLEQKFVSLEEKIPTLIAATQAVDDKFSAVHDKNAEQGIKIARILTFIGLK